MDYRQSAHVVESDDPTANVASAFAEVQIFAESLGCESGDLTMHPEIASDCADIGASSARVCLVATNEGQFFVHEVYPDLVSVLWNRWD